MYSWPRYKELVTKGYLYITIHNCDCNLNTSHFLGTVLMPFATWEDMNAKIHVTWTVQHRWHVYRCLGWKLTVESWSPPQIQTLQTRKIKYPNVSSHSPRDAQSSPWLLAAHIPAEHFHHDLVRTLRPKQWLLMARGPMRVLPTILLWWVGGAWKLSWCRRGK